MFYDTIYSYCKTPVRHLIGDRMLVEHNAEISLGVDRIMEISFWKHDG